MIAHVLALHPFVTGLTDAQVTALASCATPVRFDAGATIFREGQPADACYLLHRGDISLQMHAPDGPLVVETIYGAQVLGWSWLVPPHRWRFDAVAIDAVDAIRLDAACTRRLLRADPELGAVVSQRLLAVVSDRLAHTRVRLLDVYRHRHATGS
jgi:CRP-like cAMP-binding protein